MSIIKVLIGNMCEVSRVFLILVNCVKRSNQSLGSLLKYTSTCMNGSCLAPAVFSPSKNFTLIVNILFQIFFPSFKSPYFAIFQMLGAGVFHNKVKRVERKLFRCLFFHSTLSFFSQVILFLFLTMYFQGYCFYPSHC